MNALAMITDVLAAAEPGFSNRIPAFFDQLCESLRRKPSAERYYSKYDVRFKGGKTWDGKYFLEIAFTHFLNAGESYVYRVDSYVPDNPSRLPDTGVHFPRYRLYKHDRDDKLVRTLNTEPVRSIPEFMKLAVDAAIEDSKRYSRSVTAAAEPSHGAGAGAVIRAFAQVRAALIHKLQAKPGAPITVRPGIHVVAVPSVPAPALCIKADADPLKQQNSFYNVYISEKNQTLEIVHAPKSRTDVVQLSSLPVQPNALLKHILDLIAEDLHEPKKHIPINAAVEPQTDKYTTSEQVVKAIGKRFCTSIRETNTANPTDPRTNGWSTPARVRHNGFAMHCSVHMEQTLVLAVEGVTDTVRVRKVFIAYPRRKENDIGCRQLVDWQSKYDFEPMTLELSTTSPVVGTFQALVTKILRLVSEYKPAARDSYATIHAEVLHAGVITNGSVLLRPNKNNPNLLFVQYKLNDGSWTSAESVGLVEGGKAIGYCTPKRPRVVTDIVGNAAKLMEIMNASWEQEQQATAAVEPQHGLAVNRFHEVLQYIARALHAKPTAADTCEFGPAVRNMSTGIVQVVEDPDTDDGVHVILSLCASHLGEHYVRTQAEVDGVIKICRTVAAAVLKAARTTDTVEEFHAAVEHVGKHFWNPPPRNSRYKNEFSIRFAKSNELTYYDEMLALWQKIRGEATAAAEYQETDDRQLLGQCVKLLGGRTATVTVNGVAVAFRATQHNIIAETATLAVPVLVSASGHGFTLSTRANSTRIPLIQGEQPARLLQRIASKVAEFTPTKKARR